MNKKRICIDINSIVPLFVRNYLSGIGRTTLELVQALSNLKDEIPFDITLYSQNMKGIGGNNLKLSFKNRHIYLPHREDYNKILQYIPIREILTNYDIMHVPHNFEYLYAPQKTIITLHDAFFMKIDDKKFGYEKMRQQIPPLIRNCKAIITCSQSSKKDIIETMDTDPDKIHVIPWGIKDSLFYPEKDEASLRLLLQNLFGLKRPYFLSVSCSEGRKNTLRLIESYIKFAESNPKNDLCLVWNAPDFIREKIANNGMSNRIHLITNVIDEHLRKLYCGATATIYPSLYEGFGLPILESMACGTPVITSNLSSLPEVGGDVAFYINPLDQNDIRESLFFFEQQSKSDRESLSEKGIERVKEFSWKKCALNTISVYNKYLY